MNKRALQAILIAGEDGERDIRSGKKEVTIRKWYCSYTEGPVLLGCHVRDWAVMGKITSVLRTTLKEVPMEDVRNDGFYSHEDALNGLKRFYPDMTLDSPVTVVRFKVMP